jgi:hypothetical protein
LSYIGDVGRFAMRHAERDGDDLTGVVEHHMAAAYPPELLEDDVARDFRVSADRLTLGDGLTWKRSFDRAPPIA